MQYRRAFSLGGQYFFTLVTENRREIFTNDATINTLRQAFNLEKSVGPRKAAQPIGMPGKPEKALITSKVTTSFSDSPFTPMGYTSFSRPTDFSRFKNVMTKRPFTINAAVILPDHIHCIWTLPADDSDFATRWRLIKTWFTRHCDPLLRISPKEQQKRRGEQAIWQHRYWEHLIRDEADLHHHIDYIHYNPVKHGLVSRPVDWPYSSFPRYVKQGTLSEKWGGIAPDIPGNIGLE